jgi:hypothetical protein
LQASVVGYVEAEQVDKKAQAAILIANEDVYAVQAQVWGLAERRGGGAHGRDYKAEQGFLRRAIKNRRGLTRV